MRIYKFGGASVSSASGVKNLGEIIKTELLRQQESSHDNGSHCATEEGCECQNNLGYDEGLFIIVSAMGTTTNELERVVDALMDGDRSTAHERIQQSLKYHLDIIEGLFGEDYNIASVNNFFKDLTDIAANISPQEHDYDTWYDKIVGHGELISTTIISEYLNHIKFSNTWLDMRKYFITDNRHRDANIDIEKSTPLLRQKVMAGGPKLFIGQGFIGAATDGTPTTLGREGSDYSAAVAAYILDAESVTIWKDVEGILNADPKIFADTTHIPELTYLDAIELAYSGAQIIHPKTIKPIQNKNIPLYVRPFGNKSAKGSVVKNEMEGTIDTPILIVKHNQVLLSIRPKDFSFMIEDELASIFTLLAKYNAKINMVQSSAVNLSISVDASRRLSDAVDELKARGFRVVFNDDMELLTIRGYTPELYERYSTREDVYLIQRTRRTVRIVRKKTNE